MVSAIAVTADSQLSVTGSDGDECALSSLSGQLSWSLDMTLLFTQLIYCFRWVVGRRLCGPLPLPGWLPVTRLSLLVTSVIIRSQVAGPY